MVPNASIVRRPLRLHERELGEPGYREGERKRDALLGRQERLALALFRASSEVRGELPLPEEEREPGEPEGRRNTIFREAVLPLPLLNAPRGHGAVEPVHVLSAQSELSLYLLHVLALQVGALETKMAAHCFLL
jgi:hypothetical protein